MQEDIKVKVRPVQVNDVNLIVLGYEDRGMTNMGGGGTRKPWNMALPLTR
jgi:hypothetical protein